MQAITENKSLKMTSVELAEITGKEHKNIMRDIRAEIEALSGELDQLKFEPIFFETKTIDSYGRQQPCYTFGRDGAMQLALKYDAVTRRRVIVKLEELEKPQLDTSGLSPHLQMFNNLFLAMANQEMQLKQANETAAKALITASDIKDTIIQEFDNWRDEVNRLFNKIQKATNMPFSDLRTETYAALENKAGCDLSARARNLKKRLAEEGATKTKISAVSKMDVIESDKKLKEIYTQIIKEYAVKYSA